MSGKYPGMLKIALPMVDVRDAALAHLRAAVEPAAKNQRIMVVNKALWMTEMAKILNYTFPNYKVPEKVLPYCSVKMISMVSPKMKLLMAYWGKDWKYKNEKSK